MSIICSAVDCWSEEKDITVGTSTNCSAISGSLSIEREQRDGDEILGTSITCSTGVCVSTSLMMSTSCAPACGKGTSSICTHGKTSTMCSSVCRWTRSCGRPSTRGGGIPLVLETSFWLRRASYAVPTWNEWWVTVASTAATVCCSCRHHERRRRCLRRFAAPVARSASIETPTAEVLSKGYTEKKATLANRDAW